MRKTKSKLNIGKLFYNDKFVMCFSIFVAFILWIFVSTTSQETKIFTVGDIPISLPELSNDLKFFNDENMTAEVKISGNALIVASVTKDDIYVTASDISQITEPGTYTLNLVPKKSGVKTDYVFESTVSPSKIQVYVDRYTERELTITDSINVTSTDSSSYVSSVVLSKQTVKVTGAESVINSIEKVSAEYNFTTTLSKTETISVPLVFYDSNGKVIESKYINSDIKTVDATIPILKIKTVNVIPSIINMPSTLDFNMDRITVSPSTVDIAAPEDVINNISSIQTSEIDFSKINLTDNTVNVNLVIPSGCKELSQTNDAKVKFDMTDMKSKSITINNFQVINEGTDRKASVSTKSVKVILIGPKDQINSITAANVTAVINMESRSNIIGFVEMPITVNINSKFSSCWVYGSYKADVNVISTNSNANPNTG